MTFSDAGSASQGEEDFDNDEHEKSVKKKKKEGPFEKLGLEQQFVRVISRLGYKLPTPIQRKAIPAILSGRDVVAMARTGSGKTAAFGLPAIQRLREHSLTVGIRCVILEPTRELAFQVAKVIKQLCKYTNLRVCVVVGGSAMENQFERLANNPDIVIAAPGRLLHHMAESELTLGAVEYLVMDEADQLFELGMGEQLDQILKCVNPNRQCVFTSATLPSQLYEFSKAGLRSPEFIRLNVEDSISENLDLWFLYIRTEEKLPCLLFLLRELLNVIDTPNSKTIHSSISGVSVPNGTIVFVASRHHVDFLGALLNEALIPTSLAYGSMDQQARVESLASFRKGKTKFLIVTDVAARGLDIPTVGTIINFDFPMSPKHFVHRVGRTARAGRTGLAISLVTHDELPYAVELLLFAGLKIDIPEGTTLDIMNNRVDSKLTSVISPNTQENTITTSDLSTLHNDSNKKRRPIHLGTAPDLSSDVEFVRRCLECESDVAQLYKFMLNSYIQYSRMRRQPSKQSVRRAKQLVRQSGGASKLLNMIHPGLLEIASKRGSSTLSSADRESFLEELRKVKPRTISTSSKSQYGALPVFVVQKMDHRQFMSNLKNFSMVEQRKTQDDSDSGDLADDICQGGWTGEQSCSNCGDSNEGQSKKRVERRNGDSNDVKILGGQKNTNNEKKPKISMAVRRALKKQGVVASSEVAVTKKQVELDKDYEMDNVFDWKAQATQRSNFFLSSERNSEYELSHLRESCLGVHSNGLRAMSEAQFNLLPDNEAGQRKAKHVRKWDAIRKRYVMMAVDSQGRALRMKEQKKRNEAGLLVRGELRKTGMYRKWCASSKRRIQRVGEIENGEVLPRRSNRMRENVSDDDGESLPELSALTKDKGLIEAIEKGVKLTHKQARKAKRLYKLQRGEITIGHKGDEVRNARQLTKAKKDSMKSKARQSVKIRAELHRKGKEKHMRKRAIQNEAKAASRRSFTIMKTGLKKKKRMN